MSAIRTEVEFTLPLGYQDSEGNLHKEGVMRLATASDEILPLKDSRVINNPAYLPVLLLSRVVVRLGTLEMVNTRVIENLFAADFAYLQNMYKQINHSAMATGATVSRHKDFQDAFSNELISSDHFSHEPSYELKVNSPREAR